MGEEVGEEKQDPGRKREAEMKETKKKKKKKNRDGPQSGEVGEGGGEENQKGGSRGR